ncbi:MAG: hypothetical protein FWF29_05785 [Treponema sp.]|nr:hypothetical protein [Treponema sp.]
MKKAQILIILLCFFVIFAVPVFAQSDTNSADTSSSDTQSANAGYSDNSATDTGSSDVNSADTNSADSDYSNKSSADTGSADTNSADDGSSDNGSSGSESDYYGAAPPLYSKGDKTFNISLGLLFPTLFIRQGKVLETNMTPVGGAGCLIFNYFLNAHVFLGGEISGQFNGTLANNTLFIIPIGIRGGYQFLAWKMEFPLTLAAGIAPQKFLDMAYLGLYIKGSAAAYYRFSPDWSFGMDLSWSWFPEWTKHAEKNVDGNFINLMLTARYHF